MAKIGEIREIFRSGTEVRFEWRIWKIFSMPEKVGSYYWSASVWFSDITWHLRIYPYGVSSVSKVWIGLEVVKNNVAKFGRFTLGIRKADGTEEKIAHDQSLPEYHGSFTVNKFLQRSDLLSRYSQLAPLDVFTVIFAIRCDEQPFVGETKIFRSKDNAYKLRSTSTRKEECALLDSKGKTLVSKETQTEDASNADGVLTLQKHLKDLLLDGNDHDVTFNVKDKVFRAHRSMLRARSPVFAAMFTHEMKERTNDPIPIVDCGPEAFGEFLQYVYTGKVENFSPSTAVGLYYAGDKYDVSGLKKICIEFLKDSFSTTSICDVITLAARYGEEELFERAMAFFSEHLDEIMSTKEWQRLLAEDLVQANELCIKAVKSLKATCAKR